MGILSPIMALPAQGGSGEPFTFFVTSDLTPQFAKDETIEDASTTTKTASLELSEKRLRSKKFLKKFFSNLTKEDKLEAVDEEGPNLQRSLIDLVPTNPAVYLRPLGYKLKPRMEPG